MIQLFATGSGLLKKYKFAIFAFMIASACVICFFAGVSFSKNAADLKIANMAIIHKTQLDLIAEANRISIDEKRSQINHLQEEFAIADKHYHESIENVKTENDRLNECLKSGKCVQRAKVKTPVCANAGGKATDRQGADEAVYAELEPAVAAGARRVVNDADQIIMSCNEFKDRIQSCVDKGLCWIKFI